jgi:hypothetical protein
MFSSLNGNQEKNILIRQIKAFYAIQVCFLTDYETFEKRQCQNLIQIPSNRFSTAVVLFHHVFCSGTTGIILITK